MVLGFVLSWIPIGGAENQLLNTIWIIIWNMVFFASYTMCLIAFYGSLSTACTDEPQRLRVSGYKSFFDTISYCIVYALVPLLLDLMKMHVNIFVFFCTPLMLTMLIPLFLIKEGEKYGYPENEGLKPEKISIAESVKLTFKNRIFRRWTYVNCCSFFGLQMFLSAMNGMIIGGMGFDGLGMAIANTCAFAPVPIMLYLFNKSKAKWGVRATYQSCLLLFAVAIMSFFFASTFVCGTDNVPLQFVISCTGSVCGSWAIGAFFMMPYLAPAQIASVEQKLTGRNHTAMYFAGNAVTTSIVGAISGSLVYEYIKNLFISKEASGIVWAQSAQSAAETAATTATAARSPSTTAL
jgi:Na+/melibiose symporter-like transporter